MFFDLLRRNKPNSNSNFTPIDPILDSQGPTYWGHLALLGTARPRDTRILVPEKNRAAQNRAS